jgi:hypothetical protein
MLWCDHPDSKGPRCICLLNLVCKIIKKILTIRLTRVAGRVIGESQIAFLPGRNILDGVLILYEVLHKLRVKKKDGIIVKLNFEKAYDKVRWSFLKEVLTRKNFSEKWIEWMTRAVEGGRVAMNLNGDRGEFFRSYKGLRQGVCCPLCYSIWLGMHYPRC